MISILLFATALGLLLVQRRAIYKRIISITLLLTGSKKLGVWVYSIVFFPGVLLHEMSHFFAATFLGVRTGDISLLPTEKEYEGNIALGSVKIAKTDFIRESLIGAAPFIFGSLSVYLATSMFMNQLPPLTGLSWQMLLSLVSLLSNWKNLLLIYFIFVVGNTMFVSSEDTRAWPLVAILAVTVAILLYVTGNMAMVSDNVYHFLRQISLWLGTGLFGAALLNAVISLLLTLWQKILEGLFRKKVVFR